MGIFEKRINKCKDRGNNRLGNKRDHLKLKWEWDEEFENRTNKKFIKTKTELGIYKLTVERWGKDHAYYICDIYVNGDKSYDGFARHLYPSSYHERHNTRIDAQLAAESYLYKMLKDNVRKMESQNK